MASRSWNRVELIGNLTRDPELRYTPNGAAVVTFGMATNRTYVTDGEKKEEVDFHKLVAWNKLAELCNQLLKKGMRVFVSGRLQTRSWEAQDGTQRQSTEIVLEDMIILTPKNSVGMGVATEEPARIATPAGLPSAKPMAVRQSVAGGEPEEKPEEKVEEKAPQEELKDDLPF